MCGIAGSINQPLDIPRLTRDLWHRGPDEQASFSDNGLTFHHHRLAILDIACGSQPMDYDPGGAEEKPRYTTIYNGEIYNYRELNSRFGLQCRTNSDTETILQLYHRLGPAFLSELDGMFALAIYDRGRQELFLARDRAGKKPLYYFFDGKRFVFSSELNALHHQLGLEINETQLHQFVRMGYFYRQNTVYKNVHALPPGHFAVVPIHQPEVNVKRWFDIHEYYRQNSLDDIETATGKTDHYLHQAIRRRLEASDLEVGCFLSGGIDSGIITAIARKYNPSLKTFTIAFEGKYNEAPLARLVAEKHKTHHHEITISYDHLLSDIETILSNYGQPFFDNSAIPSYYVSREAKKYLTVILNGDGGDELFAGYRRYVPFARHDFFRSGSATRSLAGFLYRLLPRPHDKQTRYNYIHRLADLARKSGLPVYLSATMDSFESYEQYLTAPEGILNSIEADFERINRSDMSGLKKIMNLDFDHILGCSLLVKMDIATMAHSLEGRSPLLCKELLEYAPTLPDHYKIRKSRTKYILRRLAERYLPAELIHQPKRGFESPLSQWVDGELSGLIADYIRPASAYCNNFVVPGFVEQLWNRKIRVGNEKRAKMIWTLFVLEVWYRKSYLSKT